MISQATDDVACMYRSRTLGSDPLSNETACRSPTFLSEGVNSEAYPGHHLLRPPKRNLSGHRKRVSKPTTEALKKSKNLQTLVSTSPWLKTRGLSRPTAARKEAGATAARSHPPRHEHLCIRRSYIYPARGRITQRPPTATPAPAPLKGAR